MKCLDVRHTSRRFCVQQLWMRQMVKDVGWLKKKKNTVQVCLQVRLFIICTMNFDTVVDTLLHLQHHFSPPPWHIRPPILLTIAALPTNDPQHPPEESYTPFWSALSLTLVGLKKDTAPTIGQNVAHSHCLAYSLFHYLFSFILLSACSAEQCRAGGRGGGSW